MCRDSDRVRRRARRAVSPEVTGRTMTPSRAMMPPTLPRMCSADHADGVGGQGGVGGLQAQVVHAHGAGGPHHGDEALQNHHVVEGHAALLLALHGAADDGRLSGVEAGQDAAGHGDEEHGDEVAGGEVVLIAEGRLSAVSAGGESQGGHPLVPDVQQGDSHGQRCPRTRPRRRTAGWRRRWGRCGR